MVTYAAQENCLPVLHPCLCSPHEILVTSLVLQYHRDDISWEKEGIAFHLQSAEPILSLITEARAILAEYDN